jgi:2-haloacid dehalogenase
VHVAQSHFHDVVPARALGLTTIWINRLGERAEPAPTRELPDLSGLPDTLDELVPA